MIWDKIIKSDISKHDELNLWLTSCLKIYKIIDNRIYLKIKKSYYIYNNSSLIYILLFNFLN